MVHVWRHHEHTRLFPAVLGTLHGHLFQLQDVDVVELFQKLDLSQGCYWEAIFFMMHENLLEGHDGASLLRTCLRDFTKRSFAEFSQELIFLNSRASMEPWAPTLSLFERPLRSRRGARHFSLSIQSIKSQYPCEACSSGRQGIVGGK